MTRDPAVSSLEDKAVAQIDAAVAVLIRLITEQVVREPAGVALAEEDHSHGVEDQE